MNERVESERVRLRSLHIQKALRCVLATLDAFHGYVRDEMIVHCAKGAFRQAAVITPDSRAPLQA